MAGTLRRGYFLLAAWLVAALLLGFFWFIVKEGLPGLRPSLAESMEGYLFNSVYLFVLALLLTGAPGLGMAVALRLRLFGRAGGWVRNVLYTLGGLPSIAYGLFGLAFFGQSLGLGLGRLTGALTLGILNLPLWSNLSLEALSTVPEEWRLASVALGADTGDTVFGLLLPGALSGLGRALVLLAGRTFAESAAVVLTAGVSAPVPPWNLDPRLAGGNVAVHLWYEAAQGFPHGISADLAGALFLVAILLVLEFLVEARLGRGGGR